MIRVGVLDVPGPRTRSPALRCSASYCTRDSLAAAAITAVPSMHRMCVGVDTLLERLFKPRLETASSKSPPSRLSSLGPQNVNQYLAALRSRQPPAVSARFAARALPFAGAQEEGFISLDHASAT